MNAKQLERCNEILINGTSELNLSISVQQQQQLINFIVLLDKWNQAYNLTAIRKPESMITRHLIDTLSVSAYLHGDKIIDVGTGPGVPGIPLAIIFPERRFTLMDSNGKKVRFINQAKQNLSLENVFPIQHRVELFQPEKGYDSIVSRAFTSLEKMLQMTEHLANKGGLIQAMKGVYLEDQPLHGKWEIAKVIKLRVPGLNEQRTLINIRKAE